MSTGTYTEHYNCNYALYAGRGGPPVPVPLYPDKAEPSVADPYHFDTDPDPNRTLIRIQAKTIRIRIQKKQDQYRYKGNLNFFFFKHSYPMFCVLG